MIKPRWNVIKSAVVVLLIAGLSGCGMVSDLLFPPVSGTFVDSQLVFTHCGVERDRGQVTVFVAPSAQDERISSFSVTVQLPDYGENGLVKRFQWDGKHPGSHPGGEVSVNVSQNKATGRVSFMHSCVDADGEPTRGTEFIEIMYEATRTG